MSKIIIIIICFCITKTISLKCSGGAIFYNALSQISHKIPFSYDCNDESSLSQNLRRTKSKSDDVFVSYFLKENRFKRELIESSGNNNLESDSEDDEEEEIIEPSFHVVPDLPTPIFEMKSQQQQISSTFFIEPTKTMATHSTPLMSSVIPENNHFGSGFGEIPKIEITEIAKKTEKPHEKPQKRILLSGIKFSIKTDSKNCINLTLKNTLNLPGWIKLKEGEIIGLPSNDDISDYEFILECEEKFVDIYLSVRQRQKSRNWNHLFSVQFGSVFNNFEGIIKIVDLFNRKNSDIVVVQYDFYQFPYSFTFVNESEVNSDGGCPIDSLKSTEKQISSIKSPDFNITSVLLKSLNDLCVELEKKENFSPQNFPPSIKNQIDSISGIAGIYLLYKIRDDFCYDPEQGNRVKLELKNVDDFLPFNDEFWMQFDTKNYEIYGLPMFKQEFNAVVVCYDSQGKSSQDVIEIKILKEPQTNYSAEFSLHFETLKFTPNLVRKFIEKLTLILSNEIHVKSIQESNNHVHFKWYNTSNPNTEHGLTEIRKILFSDEGGVNKQVKNLFSPEFNLTSSGGVLPVGGWLLGKQTPVEGGGIDKVFDFDMNHDDGLEEDNSSGGGSLLEGAEDMDSTYLTTYIIPSVLIAVMILLALIIACLLSRKKYKQYNEDDNINHLDKTLGGVPVIFQEELEQQQTTPLVDQFQSHPPTTSNSHNNTGAGRGPPAPPSYSSSSLTHQPPHHHQPGNQPGKKYYYNPPPALLHFHHTPQQGGVRPLNNKFCPPPYVPP